MEKAESSREVPKWETLDRDILAVIFRKLHVMDLITGASRVCVSWFLASHNKTLWNTIDLAKLQRVEEERLSLKNILTKITNSFSNFYVRRNLKEISKFSRTVPKNLFFNFNSYIQEEDLILAAERMPNIEKLVLPFWYYHYGDSVRFAFSQWKNLKTLIIAHDHYVTGLFQFQAVGESCNNLTNLKYLGYLDKNNAEMMVRHLQSLKRLSFRCSIVSNPGVLSLIRGLQNLEILNISHCKYLVRKLDMTLRFHDIPNDDLVQAAASQKLDKFITCSKSDCRVCKERPTYRMCWSYEPEHWRNDEIKELKF